MNELGDAVKMLTMNEDLEKPEEERMRMFAEYLQEKLVSIVSLMMGGRGGGRFCWNFTSFSSSFFSERR